MTNKQLFCDLTTGVCGETSENAFEVIELNQPEPTIRLYYFTDPICSHCWALEPVLRRFEAQYGHYVKFHTVMGGLLKGWDGFADVKNGIGNPADVAGHWREIGEHSRMPIDGSLWLNDPVQSSYPPSRVYKVIQQHNEALAKTFLRRAREAVFVFNRNVGEASILVDIVNQLGLDGAAIVHEAEQGMGQQLLDEDFALTKSLGVRGFPTIVLVNEANKGVKIVGAQSLESYEKALQQAMEAEAAPQAKPVISLNKLLQQEGLLFAKEIEVMYDVPPNELTSFLAAELEPEAYSSREVLGEYCFTAE